MLHANQWYFSNAVVRVTNKIAVNSNDNKFTCRVLYYIMLRSIRHRRNNVQGIKITNRGLIVAEGIIFTLLACPCYDDPPTKIIIPRTPCTIPARVYFSAWFEICFIVLPYNRVYAMKMENKNGHTKRNRSVRTHNLYAYILNKVTATAMSVASINIK